MDIKKKYFEKFSSDTTDNTTPINKPVLYMLNYIYNQKLQKGNKNNDAKQK